MSADDPSDDELDRELTRDIPLPAHTSVRHAPKLASTSRAINPRAQLAAEAIAQSADDIRTRYEGPDLAQHMERMQAEARAQGAVSHHAQRYAAQPRRLVTMQRADIPKPPPRDTDAYARAWDQYVAAALVVAAQLNVDDVEATACDVADRLLEERRRRFG